MSDTLNMKVIDNWGAVTGFTVYVAGTVSDAQCQDLVAFFGLAMDAEIILCERVRTLVQHEPIGPIGGAYGRVTDLANYLLTTDGAPVTNIRYPGPKEATVDENDDMDVANTAVANLLQAIRDYCTNVAGDPITATNPTGQHFVAETGYDRLAGAIQMVKRFNLAADFNVQHGMDVTVKDG